MAYLMRSHTSAITIIRAHAPLSLSLYFAHCSSEFIAKLVSATKHLMNISVHTHDRYTCTPRVMW